MTTVDAMKLSRVFLLCATLTATPSVFAEEVPQSVLDLIPELEKLGQNSLIISAVQAHNQSGLTLDTIQSRDAEWRADSGLNPFKQSLLDNDAAKELANYEATQPYFVEIFLMGNQGANVAMTNLTSDYWQGDEAKWQESFKGGAGAVHLGEVEFDESAQAYLVQVSVPVMKDGAAIGAITIGINLDELGQ